MKVVTSKVTHSIKFQHRFEGVVDEKKRECGVRVLRWEGNFIEAPADAVTGYDDFWVGPFFACDVQATKDGKEWGAGQRRHYFKTKAEREAYITKRVDEARTRAIKINAPFNAGHITAKTAGPADVLDTPKAKAKRIRHFLWEAALKLDKIPMDTDTRNAVKRELDKADAIVSEILGG